MEFSEDSVGKIIREIQNLNWQYFPFFFPEKPNFQFPLFSALKAKMPGENVSVLFLGFRCLSLPIKRRSVHKMKSAYSKCNRKNFFCLVFDTNEERRENESTTIAIFPSFLFRLMIRVEHPKAARKTRKSQRRKN